MDEKKNTSKDSWRNILLVQFIPEQNFFFFFSGFLYILKLPYIGNGCKIERKQKEKIFSCGESMSFDKNSSSLHEMVV